MEQRRKLPPRVGRTKFRSDGGLFTPQQILHCFSSPDNFRGLSLDQNLGGSRSRVIVGGQRDPVGSGVQNRHQSPSSTDRQSAVAREKVAGLANRPNNVDDFAGEVLVQFHGYDFVEGVV